jgi:predicted GIY-YIG superfamily endonuclease
MPVELIYAEWHRSTKRPTAREKAVKAMRKAGKLGLASGTWGLCVALAHMFLALRGVP